MTRHANAEQLALLAVGELGRWKTARIDAHVRGCAKCARMCEQLAAVSVTLESARYPPMSELFTARIEVALATESAERVAAMPATEASRRDLPARRRAASAERRGWRIPGLSVPATRLVTAAAAVAIIGGGGYAVATGVSGGTSGAPSSAGAPASLPGPAQLLTPGPRVTYGRHGAMHTIRTVHAPTNFTPANLPSEIVAAVHAAARIKGASAASAPAASAPSAANRASLSAGAAGSTATAPGAQLAGCVNLIADGRTVLLVEQAEYEGAPATVIVTAASGSSPAQAWVVGDSCSATSSDVLAQMSLGDL